jgi:hypothetical protein
LEVRSRTGGPRCPPPQEDVMDEQGRLERAKKRVAEIKEF